MRKTLFASLFLVLALAIPGFSQTAITQIPTPCTVGTIYSYSPQGGAYLSSPGPGTYLCLAGNVFAGWGGSGAGKQLLLTDVANATATPATFLSWPLLANTNYTFSCDLLLSSSGPTAPVLTLLTPTSPTSVSAFARFYTGATTVSNVLFSGSPLAATDGAAPSSTAVWSATFSGSIQNGANTGTLAFQDSAASGTTTIKANSNCTVQSNP